MIPNPAIYEIDQAITALESGKGDQMQIAKALTTGIKFLGTVIDQLKEEKADLMEDMEKLLEKVEELETDQGIILQFLQTQEIDISYIVRNGKSDEEKDTTDTST
jgi:chromosome segregation ATPase